MNVDHFSYPHGATDRLDHFQRNTQFFSVQYYHHPPGRPSIHLIFNLRASVSPSRTYPLSFVHPCHQVRHLQQCHHSSVTSTHLFCDPNFSSPPSLSQVLSFLSLVLANTNLSHHRRSQCILKMGIKTILFKSLNKNFMFFISVFCELFKSTKIVVEI